MSRVGRPLHSGGVRLRSELTEQTVSAGGEREPPGTESAAKRATFQQFDVRTNSGKPALLDPGGPDRQTGYYYRR